ncbi:MULTISPECIES: hypothetical protein [unclassified Leptolyngbya]|uniref:hypothetical protein n=1 Tax=unclassified Leptolyngbya TaxID=2650499 RepID=UPI00168352E8|nr:MULTISPECIES: hypothetical protein [unclassified Leptolyngbya]MBD1909233.1 hypothetical protein [Leptolyngbya sp. FACHB-8]MBD2158831.1 hypothetical protein [Leptolyngbya sp. FACHB-16]
MFLLKPLSVLLKCLLVVVSLWAIAGCTSIPLSSPFVSREPVDVNLSIDAVEATETGGVYRLTGHTNLPESTKLSLSAIRRLDTTEAASFNQEPSYTILDRQITTVQQGTWEAALNLWRVAPSGQYQEAWQLEAKNLGVAPKPSETVLFQATLEPTQQSQNLESALERSRVLLRGDRVRFTPDGEVYVYTSRDLTIALPTGRTTPPVAQQPASPPVNQAAQPSPAPLTLDATSAPLNPDEMLR